MVNKALCVFPGVYDVEIEESRWLDHRLYVSEVIELRRDLSVIVLLPATHDLCSAPGHVDLRHVDTALPLQIFEISKYENVSQLLFDVHR